MPMKLDLTDDDSLLLIRALEHYAAYLVATQRDGKPHLDLAERLKRKQPESETRASPSLKRRA